MFTLLCVIFGWLIVVDLLVMLLSSKYGKPADTPTLWRPFLTIASFDQQIRTSVPLLGWAVQAASVRMS